MSTQPDIPFTPAQLSKIDANLQALIDFCDQSYNYSQSVIGEVYLKLDAGTPSGKDKNNFNNVLSIAFILIGALPIPGIDVVTGITSSIIQSFNDSVPEGSGLENKFAYMIDQYNSTTLALRGKLANLKSDPQSHRHDIFNYTDQNGNPNNMPFSNLAADDIPHSDSTDFTNMLVEFRRKLRYTVCKEPFKMKNRWGVYFHDHAQLYGFDVARAKPARTNGRSHKFVSAKNSGDWDKGKLIFSNWLLRISHRDYVDVKVYGESDSPEDNLRNAGAKYISLFPASHIGPYSTNMGEEILPEHRRMGYYQWIILTDYGNRGQDYAVADGGFMSWLFMDDGFNNIVNVDGVGMRDDIIRNWMINGDQIPKDITP